jgi:hypothetical protein
MRKNFPTRLLKASFRGQNASVFHERIYRSCGAGLRLYPCRTLARLTAGLGGASRQIGAGHYTLRDRPRVCCQWMGAAANCKPSWRSRQGRSGMPGKAHLDSRARGASVGPTRGILERSGDAGHVTSLAMCDYRLGGWPQARPMDQRIESFLTDVLALAGEEPDAVREGCASPCPTARHFFGCESRTSA